MEADGNKPDGLVFLYKKELNQSSLNSFAPGRFKINFRKVIFQLILVIDG